VRLSHHSKKFKRIHKQLIELSATFVELPLSHSGKHSFKKPYIQIQIHITGTGFPRLSLNLAIKRTVPVAASAAAVIQPIGTYLGWVHRPSPKSYTQLMLSFWESTRFPNVSLQTL